MSARPGAAGVRLAVTLAILTGIALLAAGCFMTLGLRGRLDIVLPLRGVKLASLLLVAHAIAVSTVLFQTVTNNRILTPAVMGFDALFILIQTLGLFVLGSGLFGALNRQGLFLIETACMVGFAVLLYRRLILDGGRSLHVLLLCGVVAGVFFRSLSNLMQRMIDPNDFVVLQDRFFANFNTIERDLLVVSMLVVAGVSVVVWRMRHVFDVLALGRDAAIGLGLDYRAAVTRTLVLVTLLVSVSTALVGPVLFFGLLVANLAYHLVNSYRHALLLPAVTLIAMIVLVGGQLVLERLFAFNTALSIVIEFFGGTAFLLLLLRGAAR